jgi:molybdate transport system permease protein
VTRRREAPLALLVPAAAGVLFLVLPLVGLLARAPWSHLGSLLSQPAVRDALRVSLLTATLSTLVSLVVGVPLAWVVTRVQFPGRRLLRALLTLPLVLPPVVGGVALLYAFGRKGLFGHPLHVMHVDLSFTTAAVVLAETFVAMPFLIISVEGALSASDGRYEEAASTLGAGTWTTFRRVTLPLLGPSIAAGSVLVFARALGEFGATITFAGNLPGVTQTLPIATYVELETTPSGAIALALLLLGVSILVLLVLRERWLRPVRTP